MLYFRYKNLALNITDCVSLVGSGSSVVGALLRNLGKFVYHLLPVSFGRDTKSSWSVLSDVCDREGNIPHGGNCVTCRELHVLV